MDVGTLREILLLISEATTALIPHFPKKRRAEARTLILRTFVSMKEPSPKLLQMFIELYDELPGPLLIPSWPLNPTPRGIALELGEVLLIKEFRPFTRLLKGGLLTRVLEEFYEHAKSTAETLEGLIPPLDSLEQVPMEGIREDFELVKEEDEGPRDQY